MNRIITGEAMGRPAFQVPMTQSLRPYIVDIRKDDNIMYLCYTGTEKRIIEKCTIDETNGQLFKMEKAYGRWEDRETLNYVPINDDILD